MLDLVLSKSKARASSTDPALNAHKGPPVDGESEEASIGFYFHWRSSYNGLQLILLSRLRALVPPG